MTIAARVARQGYRFFYVRADRGHVLPMAVEIDDDRRRVTVDLSWPPHRWRSGLRSLGRIIDRGGLPRVPAGPPVAIQYPGGQWRCPCCPKVFDRVTGKLTAHVRRSHGLFTWQWLREYAEGVANG